MLSCTRLYLLGGVIFIVGCQPSNINVDEYSGMSAEQLAEEIAVAEFGNKQFDIFIHDIARSASGETFSGLEETLGRKLDEYEKNKLIRTMGDVTKEVFPEEEWTDAVSELYLRKFSRAELEDILVFYESDTGKRYISMQMEMYDDYMTVGEDIIYSKFDEFTEAYARELLGIYPELGNQFVEETAGRITFQDSVDLCGEIQRAKDIPIGCSYEVVDGFPSMFVSLNNADDLETYWSRISENLTVPFCEASNRRGIIAYVYVYVVLTEVARRFDCQQATWSDWIAISRDKLM